MQKSFVKNASIPVDAEEQPVDVRGGVNGIQRQVELLVRCHRAYALHLIAAFRHVVNEYRLCEMVVNLRTERHRRDDSVTDETAFLLLLCLPEEYF